MRVTEIHELNKVVVAYSGNAFWFDSMTEAEEFMRKIEDSLLFQQAIKKIKIKAETPLFFLINANIRSGPKHYTIHEAWLSRKKFKKNKKFLFSYNRTNVWLVITNRTGVHFIALKR